MNTIAATDITTTKSIQGWLSNITIATDSIYIDLRTNNAIRRFKYLGGNAEIKNLSRESIVTLQLDATNDTVCTGITVIHAAAPLPTVVDIDNPNLMDLNNRHLHIRSEKLRATGLFRHFVFKYAKEFLDGIGCFQVQTPILTEASCVCSGDVFTFPYYGKKVATLIQSPWIYADALTSSLERVYALNPSFRRERTETNIHLVEIWQLQVDIAWIDNQQAMKFEEQLVRYIGSKLIADHQDLYTLAGLDSGHLSHIDQPFSKVSYDQTIETLRSLDIAIEYGDDYSKEQTEILAKQFDRPFFITDFPQSLKNFWFPVYKDRPSLTPSNDLFAHTGHGELIGGGSRVSDSAELLRNLEFFGHDQDEFDWFVDTRKYGCAPHAGFSIGFDRLVSFFMGVSDVREATLFPRVPHGPIKP